MTKPTISGPTSQSPAFRSIPNIPHLPENFYIPNLNRKGREIQHYTLKESRVGIIDSTRVVIDASTSICSRRLGDAVQAFLISMENFASISSRGFSILQKISR